MEEQFEPQESRTYSTGSTKPPKKSGCLIAFLLMVAIFFFGIFRSLGLFNFSLLRRIEITDPNETVSIVVYDPDEDSDPLQTAKAGSSNFLGITGESIPLVYQMYYQLPNGLMITTVEPGSASDSVGISPGDILLSVENMPVTDLQELETALHGHSPGDTVWLTVYRNGTQNSVSVILGEGE